MPKYLFEASYTAEGTKGLLKEGGTSRRALVEQMVSKMGGTLEGFYYAFGESDIYAFGTFPDAISAAAVALAVNQTGAVRIKTRVLMTPEEVDEVTKKTVDYRPPGA